MRPVVTDRVAWSVHLSVCHDRELCKNCWIDQHAILIVDLGGPKEARQIRPSIQSLTFDAAKTIVQAFIACRLDWCNSLLYGVPENLLRKVQSVQNAAARLLTNTLRRDHITLVLRQLHWLPFQSGVQDCVSCTPITGFNGTDVPVCRHSSCLRAWSPSPLIFVSITHCSTDANHLWWPKLHCRRTVPVEQFAGYSKTAQQLQTV